MLLIRFLVLSTLLVSVGFAADSDPFLGKWKLNWSKSHSSDAAPKRAIRKYTKSGEGVRVSEDWVGPDGKHLKLDYIANYDGKEYPVRTNKTETVSFRHTDPFIVEGASKVDGKVRYLFKRIVSQDRKTLTIEMSTPDAQAKEPSIVLVYERM